MANIFEFLSKDGNITPEKARKLRQMQFHDKTAYVWGLRYRWDPSLSMNPVCRFAHFMPPWPILWLMPIYRPSIIFFRYIIGHYLNMHLDYAYIQCFLSRTLKLKCIGAQIVSYFENALSDFHLLSVVMSWEWANTRKWKTRFSSDFFTASTCF